MKPNHVTWLAMFLSAVAGMFCSHIASKYTDAPIEAAISAPAAPADAHSPTTVALNRHASRAVGNVKK